MTRWPRHDGKGRNGKGHDGKKEAVSSPGVASPETRDDSGRLGLQPIGQPGPGTGVPAAFGAFGKIQREFDIAGLERGIDHSAVIEVRCGGLRSGCRGGGLRARAGSLGYRDWRIANH